MTTYDSPPPNDEVSPPEADERQARIRAKKARAKERLAERQAAAREAMSHLPTIPFGHAVLEQKYNGKNSEPWNRSTRIALREGWAALFRPRAKSGMHPVWAMSRDHIGNLRKMEREEAAREDEDARRYERERKDRERAEAEARFAEYWSAPENAMRWSKFEPISRDRALGLNQIQMLQCLADACGESSVTKLAKSMPCARRMSNIHGFYKVKSVALSLCRRGMVVPIGVTADYPYPTGFALTDDGRAALLAESAK